MKIRRACALALTCTALAPAAASADTDASSRASQALGSGDGVAAAQIIRDNGWSDQPNILGDIIYNGGVIAVDTGHGDAYSDALPVAYLRGGVPFASAELSFRYAGQTVVENGPTAEQGRVGGLAVAKTQAAYAGIEASK